MGDHRLLKRAVSRERGNAGKCGPGEGEKEWTHCVAENRQVFDITGDWGTVTLDPGAWYNAVCEGGCRFMAVWVREEEKASKTPAEEERAREG